MQKLTLSLAFAASAIAMAAIQANSSYTSSPRRTPTHDLQACKVLVQKMERLPSANTWRNRLRTWSCRDDLSPNASEMATLRKEPDR